MPAIPNCSPPCRPRRGLSRRDESGAALVEFALVFGLFVMILYGLIAFGMVLAVKQGVTNASAEGARAAVGAADAVEAEAQAKDRVRNALDWLGSKYDVDDPDQFLAQTADCPSISTPTAKCITVTITYDYDAHPVVPPAPGLRILTPPRLVSTSVVQFAS